MIGTLSIKCNAAHPEMALPVIYTYKNSPSNIRVLDVPKKIGNWQITDVTLKVIYPNNTVVEVFCVRTAGAWVGTIAGTPVVGKTSNGFVITADGIDENEQPVSGYVLGVGDIEVMDCDTSLNPITNSYLMRIFETRPQTLNNGDVFIDADGSLVVNLNGELHETVSFQEVEAMIPTKVSELTNDAGYVDAQALNTALANKASKSGDTMTWLGVGRIEQQIQADANELGFVFSVENYGSALVRPQRVDDLVKLYFPSSDGTLALTSEVPTKTSDLTNDSDFTTNAALTNGLALKQDKLSNGQVQAIDYVVNENQTVVTYSDNTTVAYDIYGQLERAAITVAGKTISSIKIGKGVTSLGLALFLNDKTTLTSATIPDTVTYIGIGAFDGCANLVSIEIPESVTSVGDRAFRGCTSLQTAKVKMTGPTNTNMFYGCTSLQNLEIGNGVTSIGADAFHGCTSLTSIVIPDSVRAIGNQAFNACTGLVKVDTGNGVTRISERAFRECTNLEEVNIGDSVTTIDQSAFAVCPSLEKVTVGESVATISYNAFSGSTSALTEVVFKGKTIEEVQAMVSYPWGITDTSIIKTWNVASKEWVESQAYQRASYVTRAELEAAIANFTTRQDVQEATEGLVTRQALQKATSGLTTQDDLKKATSDLVTRAALKDATADFTTQKDLKNATADLTTKQELQDATSDLTSKTDLQKATSDFVTRKEFDGKTGYVTHKELDAAFAKLKDWMDTRYTDIYHTLRDQLYYGIGTTDPDYAEQLWRDGRQI